MTDSGALVVILGTAATVVLAVSWVTRALRELGGVR